MALSVEEREQFLAQPHIAALSVGAGGNRGPLTVPIWCQYSPGGEAWVLTPAESRKAQLIRAAGRFTLMVETLEPTIRHVSVEGRLSPIRRVLSCSSRTASTAHDSVHDASADSPQREELYEPRDVE